MSLPRYSDLAARADGALPGLVAFAAIGLTGAANGGYWPTSWGWSAAGLLGITAMALVLRERLEIGRFDAALLAGLVALLLWTAASALWSDSVPATALEVERLLVYVAGVAAALGLARRSPAPILAGVLCAIVALAAYALATRLFPDAFGRDLSLGLRLARPIGYWNAVGILAAIGFLLGLGHAAFAARRSTRALTAGSLVVLATTLYFTFSRGAWVALLAGAVVALVAEPRRARYLTTAAALAPAPLLSLWLARRSSLSSLETPLADATSSGHRLAAAVLVLALAAGVASILLGRRELSVRLGRRTRRAVVAGLALVAAAAVIAGVVRAGGPEHLVGKVSESFRGPPPGGEAQLEQRLFSFSGTSRVEYWRIARDQYRSNPWLGSGAGTFEYYWNRDRETVYGTRDAHNLYLETLAELGPVGLLLLAAALGTALLAARTARGHPLGTTALAGLSAYLLHAGVDWDWELPAVTLAGLLCAAALAAGARQEANVVLLTGRARGIALVVTAVLGALALVAYRGNVALAKSADFADRAEYGEAAREARVAARWLPWAAEPRLALGEAELALGDPAAARATFRRGLEQDPRDWRLWLGLGLASEGAARRTALDRASELNRFGVLVTAPEGG